MNTPTGDNLSVIIFSFGFKYGVPVDANFLWDVRFLPNPYWDERLRPLTGRQREIADFVIGSDEGKAFLKLFDPLLSAVIGCQQNGTKKLLRVAIGCTGGRHRSVAVAEYLTAMLGEKNVEVRLFHRDIDKDEQREKATI